MKVIDICQTRCILYTKVFKGTNIYNFLGNVNGEKRPPKKKK